tara:strand:- start:2266 stop:3738 length:1473 start_codon:yes stop_codon:yes gene_type:complete
VNEHPQDNSKRNMRVGQRALSGVVALGIREGLMRIVAFGGDIILFRLIAPDVFGLILPITFIAGIIKHFSDLGLAASLVQSQKEPDEQDLRTVFTIQLLLASIAGTIVFFVGPLLIQSLDEGKPDHWMIRVFGISVFFSAFRVIPASMLERHLQFSRLAIGDIAGTIWFYAAGIFLALSGAGPWALITAHVGASLIPIAVLNTLKPWVPALEIHRQRIWPNLDFGAKFQAQRLLLMLKDSLIPILGPAAFGRTSTGLLSWADKLAQQPLLFTQLVARVSLPTFSRLQSDRAAVLLGTHLALKWTSLVTFPVFIVIFVFASDITRVIYGPQWIDGVSVLYWLAANAVLVPVNGLLLPIMNAVGRSGLMTCFAAIWSISSWAIAFLLIALGHGFASVAMALALSQAIATISIVFVAWKTIGIDVVKAVGNPAITAVVVGVVARFIVDPMNVNIYVLVIGSVGCLFAYCAILYATDGKEIRSELGQVAGLRNN